MARYEYRVLKIANPDAEKVEKICSREGEGGWELVSNVPHYDPESGALLQADLTFKRLKRRLRLEHRRRQFTPGDRPLSVIIVGWLLILTSPAYVFLMARTVSHLYPASLIKTFSAFVILTAAFNLVVGIAILKGRNWGRILYVVSFPIGMVLQWVYWGFALVDMLRILGYFVVWGILYRDYATKYFTGKFSWERREKL